MSLDKPTALKELVRWMGRGLRGEPSAVRRLVDMCSVCRERGVPEEHVRAGVVVMQIVAGRFGFDTVSARALFPGLYSAAQDVGRANRSRFGGIKDELVKLDILTTEALLMGDLGLLLGLYGNVDVYPARSVTVGLPRGDLKESVIRRLASPAMDGIRFGRIGRLAEYIDAGTEFHRLGDSKWRIPGKELLLTLLAARLGNPESNPASPAWIHLGVALKAWRDDVNIDAVVRIGERLHVGEYVVHGLAIVSALFPEYQNTFSPELLGITAVERTMAIPLAARKVLSISLGEQD